jgi:hypothetical protein
MSVRKYRSVGDMPSALFRTPLDPRNLEIACELSVVAARLAPRRFPPGVHRYRSVGDAAAQRDAWERTPSEKAHDP